MLGFLIVAGLVVGIASFAGMLGAALIHWLAPFTGVPALHLLIGAATGVLAAAMLSAAMIVARLGSSGESSDEGEVVTRGLGRFMLERIVDSSFEERPAPRRTPRRRS